MDRKTTPSHHSRITRTLQVNRKLSHLWLWCYHLRGSAVDAEQHTPHQSEHMSFGPSKPPLPQGNTCARFLASQRTHQELLSSESGDIMRRLKDKKGMFLLPNG
ncbi:hypothetical protein CDAR_230341 [Caerostris darwini]|uniref:Uncharacterized protein n=1 Tax=Caerostris darwini TaxID=1538125 RepID=A0AAV4MNV2_9ARAC|nr:hypothetical protein CDAR_230181 [Caerostris darwini]GIX72512.1 hypothetical protein CDAR_230341 [Caerostris darwini]